MRFYFRIGIVAGISLAWWPLAAFAADTGLTVQAPWARPAAAGQMGVVYMTVMDAGAPDVLIGVQTPVADDAQLHQSKMQGGVMEMRQVKSAPVGPGEPLVLAPGGYHIMLMGLKQALKEGDTVPVTLVFRNAGAVTAQASVQRNAPKP